MTRFSEVEYAIELDDSWDVIVLRDVLRHAAQDRANKAAKAVQGSALKRNRNEHEILQKYADRLEHIRIEEAQRIGLKLRPVS